MVLWDGSIHRWFGNANDKVCLISVIDDASSCLLAAVFVVRVQWVILMF